MKNIIFKTLTVALAALWAFGCTQDVKYRDVDVYPVSSLGMPFDDAFVVLQSGTDRTLQFSWTPGAAEDGNPVQYELLFSATSDGAPVFVMDAGLLNSVILTHKDLNKMMGTAGTASGETGLIYWTVRTSRGPKSTVYDTPRKLNLRRMLGFDEIPARLFITGSASETGEVLADAREFKLTSAVGEEGEFEIYTEIGDGTFNLVSAVDGSGRTFGIANNLLEEISEGVEYDPGVYRINVDFSVKGITMTRINEVLAAYMQNRTYSTPMVYAGGGRWQLLDHELKFDRPGWGTRGFEERYRFEVVTSMQNEVWGPLDASLDGAPGDINFAGNNYFVVVARPRTGDWDPKWKWYGNVIPDVNGPAGGEDNPWKRVNIYLNMTPERYYHYYEVVQ
jgi:hypothetical protein